MRLQQELTVMSQLVPGDGSGLKYLATTGQLSEILALWCDEDVYIINPICGWMSRTCPEVSKNSWHLYVSHMLFEIDLLSLYLSVGLNLPLFINPICD